jgi:hypothetical protein
MRPVRGPAARAEILREMSFLEHLGDLRAVLVTSVAAFLGLSIVYWFFSGPILEWLVARAPVDHMVFYAPSEAFWCARSCAHPRGMTAFHTSRLWRFRHLDVQGSGTHRPGGLRIGRPTGVAFSFHRRLRDHQLHARYGTARVQPLISVSAYQHGVPDVSRVRLV